MSQITSWVLAHDVIRLVSPFRIHLRADIRGSVRDRRRKGFGPVHRFPVARYRAGGYASFRRCCRRRDGISCSCYVLVRLGGDGRTRRTDGRPCCCVVPWTFGAIRLAGMGVGNSCPLDDRLRLSHSALVSTLAWFSNPACRVVRASFEYKSLLQKQITSEQIS